MTEEKLKQLIKSSQDINALRTVLVRFKTGQNVDIGSDRGCYFVLEGQARNKIQSVLVEELTRLEKEFEKE